MAKVLAMPAGSCHQLWMASYVRKRSVKDSYLFLKDVYDTDSMIQDDVFIKGLSVLCERVENASNKYDQIKEISFLK